MRAVAREFLRVVGVGYLADHAVGVDRRKRRRLLGGMGAEFIEEHSSPFLYATNCVGRVVGASLEPLLLRGLQAGWIAGGFADGEKPGARLTA